MRYVRRQVLRGRHKISEIYDRPPQGVPTRPFRTFERKGHESILRIGLEDHWLRDVYHRTLVMSWPMFIGWMAGLYIIANILFAALYMIDPAGISNARPGHFLDFYFFSVQTFTTVGYGRLIPTATYSSLVASAELFAGMLVNATLAGLAFARFSRPQARVLFSDVAVVTQQSGRQVFCVRLANERRSNIFAADVEATLVRLVAGPDGRLVRRYEALKLTRHHAPIFSLTFIAEHVLDETSPLHGINATSMQLEEAEIVITVSGLDNVTSQLVHASAAYGHDTILWHRRFADIVGYTNDGYRVIDYRRFHTTENCEHAPG